jgi:5-methylcytosine-specific restriction endonuclease McrA
MGLDPTISRAVYQRDDWRCRHCRNREGLHPHHVVYKSHGGADTLDNIVTLCWKCHRAVHDGFLRVDAYEKLIDNVLCNFWRLKGWKP